ncbi:hypothetical protein [Bradyrhizobium guangdongense]
MNFRQIADNASARLASLQAEQAATAKRIRSLDTATAALGDHTAVNLLREELATLKAEGLALTKHINAVKSLISAAKSCTATAAKSVEAV